MDYGFCRYFTEEPFKKQFATFMDLLVKSNEKYNLTAICDEKSVYIKHFYDSILPESEFFKGADVVEIGSGGGFPSVPLKIIRDDLSFTLIESTAKKCDYLKEVVDKLNLKCVKVLNMRAEDGGRDKKLREKFDICTARAVARLDILCEYCLPFVKTGGKLIAYKALAQEEIEEARNAISILGGELVKIQQYELPENMGMRTAVVIKKVCATPEKYPRGNGAIRKKPL